MKREFHLLLKPIKEIKSFELNYEICGEKVLTTYYETFNAVLNRQQIIYTHSSQLLSTDLLEAGCKVFVWMCNDEKIEIHYGTTNTWAKKDIRKAHNLRKMLFAGTMGDIL